MSYRRVYPQFTVLVESGFSEDGIWVAMLHNAGPIASQYVAPGLGWNTGWRPSLHLRVSADLTGDGRTDLVAIGDAGVWVCLNQGEGPRPREIVDVVG